MKNITRIDNKRTHGWRVRFYASGKEICSKLFSDKKCGNGNRENGYWLALGKAARFLKHCQDELPIERYPMQIRKHVNNKSGVVGVFKRIIKRKNDTITAWVGHYRKGGKTYTKQFLCTIYDPNRAFRLAHEFRKQGMSELLSKKLKHLEKIQKFEKEKL